MQQPRPDALPTIIHVMEFFTSIRSDTDVVAVLRGHLYVEAVLTEIIITKYDGAAPIVRWLDFMRKVKIARENGLIEGEERTALQALGHVRDSFVHLPIKEDLTTDDDNALRTSLACQPYSRYNQFLEMLIAPNPDKPGRETRAAIGALYDLLSFRLMEARRQ